MNRPDENVIEEQVDAESVEVISSEDETIADETLEAIQALEAELAAAKAEAARNLDGWQRSQADFANARKRMERQQAEAYINANSDVVARLLPVLDDFELALETAPAAIQQNGWYSGMQMVHRKLQAILEGMNVKPIEAVGQPFDPNFHEALSQEPSDEFESGLVTREVRKGYLLGDRVIRPSMVYVAQ